MTGPILTEHFDEFGNRSHWTFRVGDDDKLVGRGDTAEGAVYAYSAKMIREIEAAFGDVKDRARAIDNGWRYCE